MNEDQQLAFNLVKNKKNVFITGSAGTGKSFVLREIIQYLKDKYKKDNRPGSQYLRNISGSGNEDIRWAVTSLTGVSSIPIGGRTLHSWAGIGLGDGTVNQLINRIRKFRKVANWVNVEVLIIDEISMMDLELFEKLHMIGQKLRHNPYQLFGGIQIVMSGDFLQLPPVGIDKGKFFCFESPIWQEYIKNTVFLTKIFRQTNTDFQELLCRLRLGIVTDLDRALLNSRLVSTIPKTRVKPTKLYPFKKDVRAINEKELFKLIEKGEQLHTYLPHYEYRNSNGEELPTEPHLRYAILAERNTTQDLVRQFNNQAVNEKFTKQPYNSIKRLIRGAQVMLTWNVDVPGRLVNGSRGVITGFDDAENPIVLFDMGDGIEEEHTVTRIDYEENFPYYQVIIKQYPLDLAWAATIHKSQSQTLTKVVTDLNCVFSPGQTYVCLSRVRSLDGLYLLAIDYNKIWAHPRAKAYYRDLGYECQVQATPQCQLNPFVPTSAFPGQNMGNPGVCKDCLDYLLMFTIGEKYCIPITLIGKITKYIKRR